MKKAEKKKAKEEAAAAAKKKGRFGRPAKKKASPTHANTMTPTSAMKAQLGKSLLAGVADKLGTTLANLAPAVATSSTLPEGVKPGDASSPPRMGKAASEIV